MAAKHEYIEPQPTSEHGFRVEAHCRPDVKRGHNIRDPQYVATRKNIDLDLPHQILIDLGTIPEAFDKIFGPAIEEYNSEQRRKDRRKTAEGYAAEFLQSREQTEDKQKATGRDRGKDFTQACYEFQYQIGNRDNFPDREKASEEEFNKANEVLYKSAWRSQFFSGMMMPVMMFVGNLGYVAVAVLGAVKAMNGTMTVGDIQAFIQYVKNFTQPISQMAQVSSMVQSAAAAAERVFEFLEEDEEPQKAENHAPVAIGDVTANVTFDHVKFGYDPEKIIIHDFSANVKNGQKIAIVGPTGAGKTTLVKLLMRFYDLNGGSIKIGGHDINSFDRSELREAFGMVLQDTWLFNGTIMENIRYGRLDATDEEVIAAAKAAHVHRFIETLPGGYNMVLNEEASNVSQGQKQLLTIARAILANNKILILDEATSSVDTRTEIRIQKAMDNLMKGRTSFIIAHRLSTIRDADVILVMRDGDIVEQGSHDELMALGGFYSELYNSQFDQTA